MSMSVRELIEYLETIEDQESEVKLMCQESWPFEYSIQGAITRKELIENGNEDDSLSEEQNINDVFLIEGTQLCYGTKTAWELV